MIQPRRATKYNGAQPEEAGVGEGTVEGYDKILEQVPAYKPGWGVVFYFGDGELLAEGTACDGYREIMQLEECGYAAISADGGQEWMSPLDEEGLPDEDINLVFFRRRLQVGRHLGGLQEVTPLGVSVYRHECVSGEVLGDYLMVGGRGCVQVPWSRPRSGGDAGSLQHGMMS